jgi:hypothetical protein
MLTYRKKQRLRTRRFDAPEPPFFARELILPYSGAPVGGLVFDWRELTARAALPGEASVSTAAPGERPPLPPPLQGETHGCDEQPAFVDGTPWAETVFGAAAAFAHRARVLRSVESLGEENDVVVFWPPDPTALEGRKMKGLLVPVIFPATTDLDTLRRAVEAVASAEFVAAVPVEPDAVAKRRIAEMVALSDEDERYEVLFHDNVDPLVTATERHIAALAAEAGLADHLSPGDRSNWSAAARLALAGSRLVRMDDVELGLTLLRSARAVANTDKHLARVAQAASLSIIEGLDEVSAEALSEWLESGGAALFEEIDSRWRLRRDYAPAGEEG